MPFEKVSAICRASKQLAERSKRELAQLQKSYSEAEAYNHTARSFLETAAWIPPDQVEDTPPAQLAPLPVVRNVDSGWNKRAEETRLFAQKTTDANVRREFLAIAQLYDLLAGAEPADRASLCVDAIAA